MKPGKKARCRLTLNWPPIISSNNAADYSIAFPAESSGSGNSIAKPLQKREESVNPDAFFPFFCVLVQTKTISTWKAMVGVSPFQPGDMVAGLND
jgi:hypothetical protein